MRRLLLIPLLPLLALPLTVGAADAPTASAAAASTSSSSNAYLAESEVTIEQPLPADLITIGGSVSVTAPVAGDVLAAGGTVAVAQGAGGDVRVAGGRVTVRGDVGGDIAAAGGSVRITGSAHSIYAAGGAVTVDGSSEGDVTIYGADVALAGEYAGDVSVIASNHFAIGKDTHIRGVLKYSAPEALSVPESAAIDGGTRYTGAYSYVPTSKQAHQYALIGSLLFFAVRVLAAAIVAGLIAGLFPIFSERIADAVLTRRVRPTLRLFLLGAALAVLTPILCVLLLVSFVGAELAFLLAIMYAFMAIVSYAFCGIVIGALLRRTTLYKIRGARDLTWQDAALGTVCVHLAGLLPLVGTAFICALALVCAGALFRTAYRTAFTTSL